MGKAVFQWLSSQNICQNKYKVIINNDKKEIEYGNNAELNLYGLKVLVNKRRTKKALYFFRIVSLSAHIPYDFTLKYEVEVSVARCKCQ